MHSSKITSNGRAGRFEIGMGWRLPPAEEEAEGGFTMKEYLKRVVSDDVANSSGGATQYKSTNTDLLSWVAEVASGRPIAALVQENVEAAGFEGVWHCERSLDTVALDWFDATVSQQCHT